MASRGEVPADIVPFLCGATLIACLKKGGICPIAICESVRRLVSKCLVTATLPEAADCLSPHQLCVGVPGGAETIIHAVNLHLTSPTMPVEDKPTLLLDFFSNAFRSIDCTSMFSEICQSIPSFSAWFECCYGSTPVLQYLD